MRLDLQHLLPSARQFGIPACMLPLSIKCVFILLTLDLRRHTSNKAPRRNISRDHGTRSHKGTTAHGDAIEDDGTDADQTPIFKGGAVDDGSVPDSDVAADDDGCSRITVQNGSILNIAARSDGDRCQISTRDSHRPEACSSGNLDITHHNSTISHPCAWIDPGGGKDCVQGAGRFSHRTCCGMKPMLSAHLNSCRAAPWTKVPPGDTFQGCFTAQPVPVLMHRFK